MIMKYTSLLFLLIFLSCSDSTVNQKIHDSNIPFLGNWTRSFELGKDSIQHASYRIFKDSIEYEMFGTMAVKYVIKKDTFIAKDNRWIGKMHDNVYVIFIKNNNEKTITLLKKQVKDKNEALYMQMPSDTARSHFTSWNIYKKEN